MARIRPAAWLMAAVALFLLAVAGYALLARRFPAVLLDADRHGRLPRWRHRCAEPAGDALHAGARGGEAAVHLHAVRRAPVRCGGGASFAIWQVGLAVLTIGLLPVVAYLSLGLAGRPAGKARAAAAFAIAAVGPCSNRLR